MTLRARAFDRAKDLENRGVGATATVETAELSLSTAKASVLSRRQALSQGQARVDRAATTLSRARIARSEAQRKLDETVIKAEFSGRLTGVTLVKGRLVTGNEQIAKLVDENALEVAFRLPTQAHARLLDGKGRLRAAPVKVVLDSFGIGIEADAMVRRDSAVVQSGQSGRLVYARLSDGNGLKPGDFVTVNVDEARIDQAIRLPAAAYGGDGAVLAINKEQRLEKINVTLLRRQGNDVLVWSEGLSGRLVVAARTPLLSQGIKVKPLRPVVPGEPVAPAKGKGGDGRVGAPAAANMVELSDERRKKLVDFVEGNKAMPDPIRKRLLGALAKSKVPARMVRRLENRIGG